MFKVILCVFPEFIRQDAEGREQAEHPAISGRERAGFLSNWTEMPGKDIGTSSVAMLVIQYSRLRIYSSIRGLSIDSTAITLVLVENLIRP